MKNFREHNGLAGEAYLVVRERILRGALPAVSDGFALLAQNFLDAGFSKTEIRRRAVQNPSDRVE